MNKWTRNIWLIRYCLNNLPQPARLFSRVTPPPPPPVECNSIQSGDEEENLNDDCHMETGQNQDKNEGEASDDDFSFQTEQSLDKADVGKENSADNVLSPESRHEEKREPFDGVFSPETDQNLDEDDDEEDELVKCSAGGGGRGRGGRRFIKSSTQDSDMKTFELFVRGFQPRRNPCFWRCSHASCLCLFYPK